MEIVKKLVGYLFRIALLATTLVGLVFAGEHITRYVYRDITTTGDNGSYFARKWRSQQSGPGKSQLYNSWGRREIEFDEKTPENTYRIVAIGDSITFGQGIPFEERFTNRLVSALADSEKQVQVLNFAKSGMNFLHHIREIKRVLKIKPDYILLQWFANDLEMNFKGRPSYHNLAPTRKLHYKWHASSALYYVLNAGWHAIQRNIGTVGSYEDYMNKRFLDPDSEDSKNALSKFMVILNIASTRNIPIGLVFIPSIRPYLANDYPFDYLHERFISVCVENGVPYVDLREDFKPYGNNIRSLHVNQYDAHPNGFANEIIANRIMEEFGPIWRQH